MIAQKTRKPRLRIVMADESRRIRQEEANGYHRFARVAPRDAFLVAHLAIRAVAYGIVIGGVLTLLATFWLTGDVPFTPIHLNALCGEVCR